MKFLKDNWVIILAAVVLLYLFGDNIYGRIWGGGETANTPVELTPEYQKKEKEKTNALKEAAYWQGVADERGNRISELEQRDKLVQPRYVKSVKEVKSYSKPERDTEYEKYKKKHDEMLKGEEVEQEVKE